MGGPEDDAGRGHGQLCASGQVPRLARIASSTGPFRLRLSAYSFSHFVVGRFPPPGGTLTGWQARDGVVHLIRDQVTIDTNVLKFALVNRTTSLPSGNSTFRLAKSSVSPGASKMP